MVVYVNGTPRDLSGEPSIHELLDTLGIERGRVAVSLNRSVVPRSRHGEVRLQPDDRVEIVQAVQGG